MVLSTIGQAEDIGRAPPSELPEINLKYNSHIIILMTTKIFLTV